MKTIVYQVAIFRSATDAEVVEFDNETVARFCAESVQNRGGKVQLSKILREYDGYNYLKFNDKLIQEIKV